MLFIVGMIIVFGCVIGGFSVHGDLRVLWQPIEFVIIFGAGTGAFIISNTSNILKDAVKAFGWLFKGKPYGKKDYMELLKFLFEMFKLMKTQGLLQVEKHIENPHESEIFKKYPLIMKDHHAVDFFCDYVRLMTIGVDNHYVMSDAMDKEIDIHHHEAEQAVSALVTFGESLPALGIVAAVLGVIVTMKSISEPPEILGGLIAAALVGTFAGILLSYGVFSPIGSFAGKFAGEQGYFYGCIKSGIIAHMQGNAPTVSVEFVRKSVPGHYRPSFKELEQALSS